jgi:MEMO1 family protein
MDCEGKEIRMQTRKAMFSGSWYPGGKNQCLESIESFLKHAPPPPAGITQPSGGIVPHAGWYFSGELACRVIHTLKGGDSVDMVMIFGMHLPAGDDRYLMKEGAWDTPLGPIEIDAAVAGELSRRFGFILETDQRFTPDNTIELQLPFIKFFFPNATLVPLGLPPTPDSLVIAETAVSIARAHGRTIRVLGSTDLTHYGPNYGFTPKGSGAAAVSWVKEVNDHQIVEAIMSMDPNRVMQEASKNANACCPGAVASALCAAKAWGATQATLMGYTTSYDKSPGDSLVGYTGICFS